MFKKMIKKRWFLLLILVFVASRFTVTPLDEGDMQVNELPVTQVESMTSVVTAGGENEDSQDSGQGDGDLSSAANGSVGNGSVSFDGYRLLVVNGGDRSGYREPMAVVDIGYGDREYWAFTNEHGQLVRVTADRIILQDDSVEPVNSDGRYYNDEAAVPGTERDDLDQGHVIADSLGGVSNAYNITPQNSVMNRHGDQAYMEKVIRDAGGCTNFEAVIIYPDTKTQIPSRYKYRYTIKGYEVTESFDNVNPDKANASVVSNGSGEVQEQSLPVPQTGASGDIAKVDTNNNGKVTISEAKAAGYKMPITRDHWLYKYMDDRDGDGTVGE